jgi:hypothetical protein
MIDFILYALEVLGWTVVMIAVSVAAAVVFWPDKDSL